jgi:hypothetical protein
MSVFTHVEQVLQSFAADAAALEVEAKARAEAMIKAAEGDIASAQAEIVTLKAVYEAKLAHARVVLGQIEADAEALYASPTFKALLAALETALASA